MAHVLGYTLNKPPALIDEGTAVYLSQLYGDKAFSRIIGYPTKSVTASFVEFLIKEFGKQKFLELYKSLSNANSDRNEMIFEKIYRVKFNQIEYEWTKQKIINN